MVQHLHHVCTNCTARCSSLAYTLFANTTGALYRTLHMLKMKSSTVILHLLSVLIAVDFAYAIKCWECRSDYDIKCADPFDNSTLPIKDCATTPSPAHLPNIRSTLCRKTRQKVNGEWRYFRSCAFLGEPGIANDERFCIMRSGTYNIFVEYCTCNTKDGCNSAPSIAFGSRWTMWILTLCAIGAAYFVAK